MDKSIRKMFAGIDGRQYGVFHEISAENIFIFFQLTEN